MSDIAFLRGVVESQGWKIIEAAAHQEIRKITDKLLNTDEEISPRERGRVLGMKFILDLPAKAIKEAEDRAARERVQAEAAIQEDSQLEFGRQMPFVLPQLARGPAARPEIT